MPETPFSGAPVLGPLSLPTLPWAAGSQTLATVPTNITEQFSNFSVTTLANAIGPNDNSIQITNPGYYVDGSGQPHYPFPTTGQFHVLIDNEYIVVGSVDGVNWGNLTRGAENSGPSPGVGIAHAAGATVTLIATAGSLKQLKQDIVNSYLSNPLWNQTQWFLDPANSTGLASDSNSGIDANHPLLTWKKGVIAKWGTYSPEHSVQTITFTFLSGQPDETDSILYFPVFRPLAPGSSSATTVVFVYNLTVSTTVNTTAVTAKSRSTNVRLQATCGTSTITAPALLQNISIGALAWIDGNANTGHTKLSGPQQPLTLPIPSGAAGAMVAVDTWAVGNTVQVMGALPNLYIADIKPTNAGAGGNGLVQIQHFTIPSQGFPKDTLKHNRFVQFIECIIDRQLDIQDGYLSLRYEMGLFNCYVSGGAGGGVLTSSHNTLAGLYAIIGGILTNANSSVAPSFGLAGCFLGGDVVIHCLKGTFSLFGYNVLHYVEVESNVICLFGVLDLTGQGPSPLGGVPGILWGGSTFDVGNCTMHILPGGGTAALPIAVNGNNFGALLIGGQARGFAIDDSQPPNQNGNLPFSGPDLDAGFQTILSPIQGGSTWTVTANGGVANGATGGKAKTELYVGQVISFSTQAGALYRVQDQSTDISINIVPAYTGTPSSTAAITNYRRGNGGLSANLTGGATFNVTNGSATVTCSTGAFTTQLVVNQHIAFSAQPNVYYLISAIGSNTSLTLSLTYSGTTSTTSTAQAVQLGGIIYLPGGGAITTDAVGVA